MISASTLNSELINKIAQDFAQATSLAVVVVNIHGMRFLNCLISRRFANSCVSTRSTADAVA